MEDEGEGMSLPEDKEASFMVGFIFGIACVAGFIAVQRGGRSGRRRCRQRRGWHLSRIVDARPEQRDALADVVKELRVELEPFADVLHTSKASIADALRSDDPAPESLDVALGVQRDALDDLHRILGTTFAKVHGILDPDQRERLAEALERSWGARPRFFRGPYR